MPDASVRNQFFEDCAPAFPAAIVALIEFRRHVQARCRRVVEARLSVWSKALGLAEKRLQFEDYTYPDNLLKADPSSQVFFIGVRSRPTPQMSTGFCLFWDHAPDHPDHGTGVTGWVWLKGRENSRRLEQALNEAGSGEAAAQNSWVTETDSDGTYYVTRYLTAQRLATFDPDLREVLIYFAGLFEKSGPAISFLKSR